MHEVRQIAVIQGAASAEIQRLLRDFAGRWRDSARIVGVIEDVRAGDGERCAGGALVSLASGARFPIFQDQPSVPGVCNADPESAINAGEAVRRDIEAGCDLVILSKFGKLEAEQKGALLSAFIAAAEAQVPILTSVSPRFEPVWRQFTEGSYDLLPPTREAVEAWWHAVRANPTERGDRAAG